MAIIHLDVEIFSWNLTLLMKTMELWSKFMPFHFPDYCKHRIIFFKKINIVKTCVRW